MLDWLHTTHRRATRYELCASAFFTKRSCTRATIMAARFGCMRWDASINDATIHPAWHMPIIRCHNTTSRWHQMSFTNSQPGLASLQVIKKAIMISFGTKTKLYSSRANWIDNFRKVNHKRNQIISQMPKVLTTSDTRNIYEFGHGSLSRYKSWKSL